MVLGALIATAVLATTGEPSAQPAQSLFEQFGIKYTGLNGMEDYLVAADLVRRRPNNVLLSYISILPSKKTTPQAYENWLAINGYPEGVTERSTYLDVCNLVSTRFEPIQKAIEDGNRKPLSSLRKGPITLDTLFPEVSEYRQVAKMGSYAIYSDLARGNSHLAITKVEALVAFGERLAQDTLIEALVGLAVGAIPIHAIETKLDLFSIVDLKRLRALSRTWTAGPLSIEKSIQDEMNFSRSVLSNARSLKDLDQFMPLVPDEGESALPEELQTQLKRHSFEQIREACVEAQEAFFAEIVMAMKLREGERESALRAAELGAKPDVSPQNLKEFAHMFVRYMGPQFTQIHSAAMRRRTQLRLLGLHSYVLEHRWNWDRLPDKLEDCVTKELLFDPYANKTFVYQKLNERQYELYSEGTAVSGRINLSRPTPRETGGSPNSP